MTYDPRRRAVARSACRATRHHRGGVPPLQPGPQAPRAGHADRSLTLAAWQTVTKARAKCSGKGPYRRAAAAPRPCRSRRGHARGRRHPSHIAVSETATTHAVTATGTTAAITVADMSTGAPAARRGRPPPPVAASETRRAPSTPSLSHPPASRRAAGITDIVERPAREVIGSLRNHVNPSPAPVQQADDRFCLARRDPTAARYVHHQRNQAHRVVSTTWTLTCSSSNR